jgi:alkaline phosphatase
MRAPHLLTLLLTAAGLLTLPDARAREIRNVILFIGDGMGSEHLHATELWTGAPLGFRSFPAATTVTTFAARGVVTDSAAAATAMATGRKVNRFVLSQARPGNGANLPTVLEILRQRGKRTGLVTTSFLTDATPAAFGAHEASRVSLDRIAADYLNGSRPDLLLGGGGRGLDAAAARRAGYQVVTNRVQLMALTAGTARPVAGLFGSGRMPYEYDGLGALPRLTDLTSQALALLSNAPSGFFPDDRRRTD